MLKIRRISIEIQIHVHLCKEPHKAWIQLTRLRTGHDRFIANFYYRMDLPMTKTAFVETSKPRPPIISSNTVPCWPHRAAAPTPPLMKIWWNTLFFFLDLTAYCLLALRLRKRRCIAYVRSGTWFIFTRTFIGLLATYSSWNWMFDCRYSVTYFVVSIVRLLVVEGESVFAKNKLENYNVSKNYSVQMWSHERS